MASKSAGSIFVDLLLRDSAYRQGLQNSSRYTKNATNQISNSFRDVLNPVNALSVAITNLGITIATALSIQSIVRYSDEWRKLEGRLNLVSDSTFELVSSQEQLFKIAQDTRTDLSATVTLYQRLTSATNGLGISQSEVLTFTEQFNKMLITSGLTTTEASASIYQLTQAFNKGKLDGDEFRTILESAPPVLEALVRSTGKTKEAILQMSRDGKLAPQVLVDAVNSMAAITDKRFSDFSLTVGQAFTMLDNAFLKFIGQSDSVQSSTGLLANAIKVVADNLNQIAAILGVVALGFTAKLIPAIYSFIAAQAAALVGMQGNLFVMGELVVGTNALAAATVVLTKTFRLLTAALPYAAAALVIYELIDGNESLITSEKKLRDEVQNVSKELDENFKKHGKLTEEAVNKVRERIQAYQIEAKVLQGSIGDALNFDDYFSVIKRSIKDIIGETAEGLNNFFGGSFEYISAKEAIQRVGLMNQAIDELNGLLDQNREKGVAAAEEVNKKYQKVLDNVEKWLVKQRELAETLAMEKDMIGLTTVEIDKLNDARQMETEIATRAIELKGKDREEFIKNAEAIKAMRQEIIQTNYEASRTAEAGMREFFTAYQEDATNVAQNVKNVLQNAFRSAEDAFIQFTQTGKVNFRDLANSIVQDLLRIQFRKAIAGLASAAIGAVGSSFGAFASGGFNNTGQAGMPWQSFGNVNPNGGIYTGMSKFADGGYLPPGQFGIAGEAGAELLYGGKTGVSVFNQDQINGKKGNTYYIDARGADQGAVQRLQASLLALAGPGVIERRVSNAQMRGSL